jgi:lipopolysaccharide transport system ATP-binding protein
MSKVIKVHNVSKFYRIGLIEKKHDTLGAAMVHLIKRPVDNLKRLKSLSSFKNLDQEDVFWALSNVSFDVERGEVLGIIGRNGAGKSTLLKVLSRITDPSEGKVEMYGRVASLLEVGTGFNPELTGRENIYLNGTILGMTKKEVDERLDSIIEFSGIEKFIETPVKRYSSGMKVRLAFSVAAHLDPEILIIDEVLAVGDAEFQKKCLGKMEELAGGQGRTVLFVSHDMAAVSALCHRSLLLENGQIKSIGNTFDIISKYLEVTTSIDNLLDIPRTKGNQTFKIESLIVSSERTKISSVICGRPFYIFVKLKTDLLASEIKEEPVIDMRIENSLGQRLFWVSNSLTPQDNSKRHNEFVFYFKKCSLIAGIYNITVNVNYLNVNSDWLGNISDFEVGAGNFYSTGKLPPSNQGNLLVEFTLE